MTSPKYPEIEVELTGCNSNALVIVATVSRVMKRHGVPADKIAEYREQSLSGDYDNVIQAAMAWVDVV